MTDEPKKPKVLFGGNAGHAPIIFFDSAPHFGSYNGTIAMTLSAALQVQGNDGHVNIEHNVVAHLRTNIEGIKALRAAIDGALLAMSPKKSPAN